MKNDSLNLGLYHPFEEIGNAKVYLPAGEALLKSLLDKWRQMHTEMGFEFIQSFSDADQKLLHQLVFKKERLKAPFKLASVSSQGQDLASIFCKKGRVLEELISSLHFLEQTIKIFGFESKVYLASPPGHPERGVLKEALEQKKIVYQEESLSDGAVAVEFRMNGTVKGPFVSLEQLDGETTMIYRSLFGSFERWTELLIKQTQTRSRKG